MHNFCLFWGQLKSRPALLTIDDTDYDNELSISIIGLSGLTDLTLVIIKGEGVDRKKFSEPIKNILKKKLVSDTFYKLDGIKSCNYSLLILHRPLAEEGLLVILVNIRIAYESIVECYGTKFWRIHSVQHALSRILVSYTSEVYLKN